MRIHTITDLAGLIRTRRKALGMTQAELAEQIGVSRYWVLEIERGGRGAEIGLVWRALTALRIEIEMRPLPEIPAP